MKVSRFKSKGFTLFEVLVALGVFAFAIIGLLMALDSALSAASDARFETLVRRQLENSMAKLESIEPQEYKEVMEIAMPAMRITETMTAETIVTEERIRLDGFWRVRIEATWSRRGREETFSAEFLRHAGG